MYLCLKLEVGIVDMLESPRARADWASGLPARASLSHWRLQLRNGAPALGVLGFRDAKELTVSALRGPTPPNRPPW